MTGSRCPASVRGPESYADTRRGQVVLDVNADEVDDLAGKGTKQARRGRRPKANST